MFNNVVDAINYIESRKRTTKKTNLDSMYKLCALFDNPQESDIKFIHVAGTNGKGSVVSYLRNVLCENKQLKVGSFTSPYIECFNERIEINGEYSSDNDVIKYTNYIIDTIDKNNYGEIGFFEFITIMCFLYFKDRKVDIAIIEVGIGGLLDSTNVIKPILSIISNVSYDHMNILGDTLYEIGIQKLGIVKTKGALITIENEEINNLIIDTCKERNAKLILVKKADIKDVNIGLNETLFSYKEFKNVKLKMLGLYQCENASIVLEALSFLINYYNNEFNINIDNIYNGLFKTFWQGRLELINQNPLIIIDGAHNIDGINRLYEYLFLLKEKLNKKLRLILAISANKEKFKMIKKIDSLADEIIFTSFSYKRSEDGRVLYNASNNKNKLYSDDLKDILNKTLEDNDYINCFAGSLYFVSEIRKMFFDK